MSRRCFSHHWPNEYVLERVIAHPLCGSMTNVFSDELEDVAIGLLLVNHRSNTAEPSSAPIPDENWLQGTCHKSMFLGSVSSRFSVPAVTS